MNRLNPTSFFGESILKINNKSEIERNSYMEKLSNGMVFVY